MSRVLKLDNNRIVTVVSPNDVNKVITEYDAEMDRRAREAVKSAINRAKICNKPIAKYDKINKKAYIETPEGKIKYVR